MTPTLTEWASGQPCDIHELVGCAYCRDAAGIVRHNGILRYDADCAVQTYQEITGESYGEATTALRAAGYRPGSGTPRDGLAAAFRAVGFTVTSSALNPEAAARASASGRCFFITAIKAKRGHAWAVVDGTATRPYHPPFRYRVYEVTA